MQIIGYKGRPYRLLWRGTVNKGKNAGKEMAKLGFISADGDFWVLASLLTDPPPQNEASRARAPKKRCWECGCEFTYADAKRNEGDWSDSYCGC